MEGVSSEEIVGYNKALLEKMDRQIKLNENIVGIMSQKKVQFKR